MDEWFQGRNASADDSDVHLDSTPHQRRADIVREVLPCSDARFRQALVIRSLLQVVDSDDVYNSDEDT